MSAAVATFNKKLNNHAIAKHRRVSVANVVVVVVVDGPTRTEGEKVKNRCFWCQRICSGGWDSSGGTSVGTGLGAGGGGVVKNEPIGAAT